MKRNIYRTAALIMAGSMFFYFAGCNAKVEETGKASDGENVSEESENVETEESASAEETVAPEEKLMSLDHYAPDGTLIYSYKMSYVVDNNGIARQTKGWFEGNTDNSKLRLDRSEFTEDFDPDFKHSVRRNGKSVGKDDGNYTEYFYDDEGMTVKTIVWKDGHQNDVYINEYDSDFNLVKRLEYFGSEDEYISLTTCTYTYSNGNRIREDAHTDYSNGNPSVDGYIEYEYDGNGNLLKEKGSRDGNSLYVITYTYDDHNHVTSIDKDYGSDNFVADSKYEYTYDADSYSVVYSTESMVTGGMVVDSKIIYDYDDNMIRRDYFDANTNELVEYVMYSYGVPA